MFVQGDLTPENHTRHFEQPLTFRSETLRPATPAERALVRQIAFTWWRSDRVQSLQQNSVVTVGRVPFVLAVVRRALRISNTG